MDRDDGRAAPARRRGAGGRAIATHAQPASAGTPLLALRNAAFGYADRTVVSGVDLELGPGRFLGIVGPNGAGKTTFFRGVLGLIPPRAGEVVRAPVPVGYVPQRETLDAIFPLRADEVVHMGAYGELRRLGRLPHDARARAQACLERVGLADRAGAPFASLSGGQRQRVLLARALMVRPRLLLLDEPTSGVDRAAQQRILALLSELHAEGLTILIVSHQLALLHSAVEEVLWIADGGVARLPVDEFFASESYARVAGVPAGGQEGVPE